MNSRIKFIDVEGDAHTRGVQVGQASKHQIAHSLSVYRKTFELCDITWEQAIEKASHYKALVESAYPALFDEFSGMATGSGCSVEDLFTLNCRTEILPPNFLSTALINAGHALPGTEPAANECTSCAINRGEGGPIWLFQNWDWIGLQRQAVIVVRTKNERDEQFITVTEAGMLAKIGLNQYGFGMGLNILRSIDDGKKHGLPVHILLRVLLECKTTEQAVRLVGDSQFASSSNVMVADKSGAMANLELSPQGVQTLYADNNTLSHTNHFLHPTLVKNEAALAANLSSTARLETAQARISSVHNFDDAKSLLSDTSNGLESICRFADTELPQIAQIETVVGVVMDLSNMELWVSDAQPSVSDFRHYSL